MQERWKLEGYWHCQHTPCSFTRSWCWCPRVLSASSSALSSRRRGAASLSPCSCSLFLALPMVPLVQQSREWLERQVGRSDLVETHTRLGDDFLPYAIALAVGAAAVAALRWMETRSEAKQEANSGDSDGASTRRDSVWMVVSVAVIALVTSTLAGYQIYEVGASGSAVPWSELSSR
jgi:hypothetical protein